MKAIPPEITDLCMTIRCLKCNRVQKFICSSTLKEPEEARMAVLLLTQFAAPLCPKHRPENSIVENPEEWCFAIEKR